MLNNACGCVHYKSVCRSFACCSVRLLSRSIVMLTLAFRLKSCDAQSSSLVISCSAEETVDQTSSSVSFFVDSSQDSDRNDASIKALWSVLLSSRVWNILRRSRLEPKELFQKLCGWEFVVKVTVGGSAGSCVLNMLWSCCHSFRTILSLLFVPLSLCEYVCTFPHSLFLDDLVYSNFVHNLNKVHHLTLDVVIKFSTWQHFCLRTDYPRWSPANKM